MTPEQQPAAPPRSAFDLIAILFVVAISMVVFAKNLSIDNAVVFHDEYVYKVSADTTLDQAVVVARDLAPAVPNRLFLAVYSLGSYFGSNYYAFAQLLNVLFWALGLLVLYRLAALTGFSNRRALAFLGVAALMPLSAYTKYFMPESMFFAMFCASVYGLIYGVKGRIDAPLIIAGVLTGTLYFVKPHALALVGANLFFLLLVKERLRLMALFATGAGAAIVLGKLIAPTAPGQPSLGIYGPVLDGLLSGWSAADLTLVRVVAEVAAGHALFWLCAFGLSLLVVISVLVPRLRLREPPVEVDDGLRLLSLYLLVAAGAVVGMSVAFTSLSNELGRLHTRYYFFVYPLALLVLFHFESLRLTVAGKVAGLTLVIGGPLLMLIFGYGYSAVLPIALVADAPEWGFVYFFSKNLFFVSIFAFVAAGMWAVLRPVQTRFIIAVFAVTSVLSSLDVAAKQKTLFRGAFVTGREAVAVEERVGRDQMANAVVVGENRDAVTKFLFGLSSAPLIHELPAGSSLEVTVAKFPEATPLIALSTTYLVPPTHQCVFGLPTVRICTLIPPSTP